MRTLLQYHESDYFNDTDYFLIYNNMSKHYVTKVHWYNGSWFTNEGLKYKLTSVLSINCNELYDKEVEYIDTDLKGNIKKFLEPNNVGVLWKQGENYRKWGLPYYWNETYKINILK